MYDEIRKQIWEYYKRLLERYEELPYFSIKDEIRFCRDEIKLWKHFSEIYGLK